MRELEGKVALVTGSSSGLGQGIAIGMAKVGIKIVVNYSNNKEGAEDTIKQIKEIGGEYLLCADDISKSSEVKSMFIEISKKFGGVDILINNAGVALWSPFMEITEDLWDRTLDINLKGTFLCSQEAARQMIPRGGGVIVNIGSIASAGSMDCLAPYCASKGGMVLLTKCLGVELAQYNIRVNCLAPGTIGIKRNYETIPDYPKTWVPFIPSAREGQVEEVVKPVLFLISDESSYITGQTFYADGGETSHIPMPRSDFARQK